MLAKKIAAEAAVEFVQSGMTVGLGTGSTAYYAIHKIAERVKEGLHIRTVASSRQSEELALQLGIPVVPLSGIQEIDVSIDGADEVDANYNLIKGGGGALLREKILAAHSKQFVVIADESKQVDRLGKFPLPVEIVPFAFNLTLLKLKALGCEPVVRIADGNTFISDNGNYIVDCAFGTIEDPAALEQQINAIPGVVENGLFTGMASAVIIGYEDGTTRRTDITR
ncbi:ribose-5-phosphate isomerase RpiA [Paenibacillus sp. GCM10012307]|uniref:Ribose-5-phosphate isomerase A n=1 Tax=Paenibacillus roseus TaxID=2798579 RepID=A0A934MMW7_9BACL|nr:ribose-5-phosphate isomerase RpiA [Paenibacillus roseus]MBJ6360371.1 ribose-5-phosphate isomerase RpiA [Paenibacillus roseus]